MGSCPDTDIDPNLFSYNLMTECSQKSREKFLKKVFKLRNKETWTEI